MSKAVFAFLVAAILASSLSAQDKKTLIVTAVTHEARVNERTSYQTRPGQSTTDCTGTGTDSTIHVDCDTKTTPPTTTATTTQTTDLTERVMDSEGMVYTIACTDRPGGLAIVGAVIGTTAAAGRKDGASSGDTTLRGSGKCVPLTDGDRFEAEIKGTTMWVHARKGGNQGKAVKIKYRVIDIRKEMPPAPVNALPPATAGKDECNVNDVWSLGRSLGEKDDEIADAIKQHGVCKVLFFLRGESDAKAQKVTPPTPSSAPSAPTPAMPPASSNKTDGYAGAGGGHWINEVSSNGGIITLEDGSLWETSAADRLFTALWLVATNITVLKSQSPVGDYKYILINKDDGEKALAKYLGKE